MDIYKQLTAVANAFRSFQKKYRTHLTSDELFKNFTDTLDAELGDYKIQYDFLCGKDTLNIDGATHGYVPKRGDSIIMDISVFYGGAWCDVCRTYFVGEISSRQAKVYEMIKASIAAGEKLLKVGVKAEDMYAALNGVYLAHGEELVHHAGHQIGAEALLQPQFLFGNTSVLESGLYTIESGLYKDFGIRLEDDYQVDEKGASNLFQDLLPMNMEEYILQ